ncbi:MAG: TatD family hydrolase [Acidobacteria bacterium]|nr:TatD family hydrolase [Acidobacteriota bacterium]MBU1474890.1 TatD family hydrolase [Acidobacteriota bacterium]MBU2438925.1 TatD family hydrolase [Acidobacteriota bacterium]
MTIPIVDSHAHLNMADFDADRQAVLERTFKEGIRAVLCPADLTEPDRLDIAVAMKNSFPAVLMAAGIHPHQAGHTTDDFPRRLQTLRNSGHIQAVGEIGLDFYYDLSPRKAQIQIFREQLRIAETLKLPVIIHSRDAAADILESVRGERFTAGGVLHCFTEDWSLARAMLDLGFYVSFSGILTFPKAGDLRETAQKIPIDRLLVETDSPYLTPVPFRGKVKRNEPRYVRETARTLAALHNLSEEEMGIRTTANFETCFRFEIP